MDDKQPMQASGNGKPKAPDGVNVPAGKGESQGGAYPHEKREETFDGGQSEKSYEGPENPNATTE